MTVKAKAEEMKKQNKRTVKFDEDNFVPPDGGWGWIVVIAAGLANFCIFPVLQSFGLFFGDRFADLGINLSQTTTIINVNSAVTACVGLSNGPVFRRFSYRQVSLFGGLACAICISILSTMETFTGYLIVFSVLFGAGTGFSSSANALALNTYFKKKRRIAIGFSWTCTGLGPIIMPQIITLLMPIFGLQGTVLLFGGFAFNAVACALLLQPVSWHVGKTDGATDVKENNEKLTEEHELALLNGTQSKSTESVNGGKKLERENRFSERFASQYLYYDDEEQGASGIDVFSPGTPMMSRANDGWYSRKSIAVSSNSLASNKTVQTENSQKTLSRYPSISLSRQSSVKALSRGSSLRTLNRQNSEGETGKNVPEKLAKRKLSTLPSAINSPLIIVDESCEHADEQGECLNDNCSNEECMKKKITHIFETTGATLNGEVVNEVAKPEDKIDEVLPTHPWYKRFIAALVIFFDLNLLRDPVFVNLMFGVTFANLAEINFSLMTPFVLGDYKFSKVQVAFAMSILAIVDVLTRIIIPFLAGYIGMSNRRFFLFGVCMMATGRMVLAHYHTYEMTLALSVWIGIGKAFKTVFMALVIPTHVPLSRLPAASGLQLLCSGIIYSTLGPMIGMVRDITKDYAIMLHFLNIFTFGTAIAWFTEEYFTSRRKKLEKLKAEGNGDVEKS
ncbi:uncharacterized protein LOC105693129 [Athalia rosae]|uniref:uncharacterized protein LOC105693129 n=1 Tax=Athalia rosae TaxID=37344 RepID=UPI002034838C|nr:uncharacterized protein LOC105693129 [Athalia rosae]